MSQVIVEHFMKPVGPSGFGYGPRAPATTTARPPSVSDAFNSASGSSIFSPPARRAQAPAVPQQAPQPIQHATFDINNMSLAKSGTMDFFLRDIPTNSDAAKIMAAAVQGDIGQLAALLQRHNVLPDFTNRFGVTPLMAAAAQGHTDVVELLASHPLVNLGRPTAEGWTALHYAAWFGRANAVRSLLKHHAPLDAKINAGSMPHMLATNTDTAEAFWQEKNFRRFMKTTDPQNPRLLQLPQPVRKTAEELSLEDRQANDELLRQLAADAVKAPLGKARGEINSLLAKMTPDDFTKARHRLNILGAAPDMKEVFVKAAGFDNSGLMSLMQGEFSYMGAVLNRALSAAVRAGNNSGAVHRLMLWGASPDALYEDSDGKVAKYPIHREAFWRKRAGALEEMVLWAQTVGDRKEFSDNRAVAKKAVKELGDWIEKARGKVAPHEITEHLQMYQTEQALVDATELWFRKADLPVDGEKNLRAAFGQAVNEDRDILAIMAVYAESRNDRALRGTVKFHKIDGGGAIAVALLRGRFEFARKLIADGYKLNNAPDELQSLVRNTGTDAAQAFAKEHLAGKMQVEDVEKIGRRMPRIPQPQPTIK